MTNICEICGKEFAVTNRNRGKKVCSLACRTQKHRIATMRSDIKTALKELGLEAHGNQIASHYAHAKEKHPYFCDWAGPDASNAKDREKVDMCLGRARERLASATRCNKVGWDDILDCEVWEIFDALINGDTAHAVEECYDAISVLLRTIDVLEGRQKLGRDNPNEHKNN